MAVVAAKSSWFELCVLLWGSLSFSRLTLDLAPVVVILRQVTAFTAFRCVEGNHLFSSSDRALCSYPAPDCLKRFLFGSSRFVPSWWRRKFWSWDLMGSCQSSYTTRPEKSKKPPGGQSRNALATPNCLWIPASWIHASWLAWWIPAGWHLVRPGLDLVLSDLHLLQLWVTPDGSADLWRFSHCWSLVACCFCIRRLALAGNEGLP